MARKTNKTSHVLNLITNGAPAEPEGSTAPAASEGESGKEGAASDAGRGQEPAAIQNHAGDRKVIVVNASESDKISDEIRDRLEEHVEQAAESAAEAVQETAGTAGGPAPTEAAPEAASGSEAGTEAKTGDPAGTGADGAEDESEAQEKHYHMVNVMEEVLGRAKLAVQMEQYGVCTCSRCRADVLALSLTHLPAKYVVVDGNPVAPIIGYYESKYRSRILTEIMKACILVKEKPRHKEYEITADMLN